jgi:hypothetical protein
VRSEKKIRIIGYKRKGKCHAAVPILVNISNKEYKLMATKTELQMLYKDVNSCLSNSEVFVLFVTNMQLDLKKKYFGLQRWVDRQTHSSGVCKFSRW